MSVSVKQMEYQKKYDKENMSQISVKMPKLLYEEMLKHKDFTTKNAFIISAIKEKLEKDKAD